MHRPRDVVADRQMIEHVPDQHAHVVVPQKLETRNVQSRALHGSRPERPSIRPIAVGRLPRLPTGIDADRVARPEGDAARPRDVLELPAMYRPLLGHRRHPTMPGYVQQHATRDDALGPVLDGPERGAVEGDLLLRVTSVPHRLFVPRVAEGVDVSRGDSVIEDA